MRIAFSGTHYSGKSTLIRSLVTELPEYGVYDEPYWVLTELGRSFSDPPTIDDYEEQLRCSLQLIKESSRDALFDRCPLDFYAYALAISEESFEEFDNEKWEESIIEALAILDCVVYLPLEEPDRIPTPPSEDMLLRQQVDEKLRELILDDTRGIMKKKAFKVTGTLHERIKKMKQHCSF